MQATYALVADIRLLIEESRQKITFTVNSELTLLYWMIGRRIQLEILKGARAEYGAAILLNVGKQLEKEFGAKVVGGSVKPL